MDWLEYYQKECWKLNLIVTKACEWNYFGRVTSFFPRFQRMKLSVLIPCSLIGLSVDINNYMKRKEIYKWIIQYNAICKSRQIYTILSTNFNNSFIFFSNEWSLFYLKLLKNMKKNAKPVFFTFHCSTT